MERGAWNSEQEGCSSGPLALCPTTFPPGAGRRTRAFTLVELLVVVAIIGVLSSLMVPAMRGLIGVGGRRGGMNMVSSTIEKARLAAIENGTTVYVGFPFGAADPEAGYASVIVFRDKREDETNNSMVPLSRWVRMPTGVFIESDDLQNVAIQGSIPRLGGTNGFSSVSQVSALVFDRFGKLKPGDKAVEIRVGEKNEPDGPFLINDQNHFLLRVRPLTGRVTVEDRSTNSAP